MVFVKFFRYIVLVRRSEFGSITVSDLQSYISNFSNKVTIVLASKIRIRTFRAAK